MQPRTQYVKGPEGHVAYQVLGSGSRDIVFVPDHPNNIEIMWEDPATSRFLERLATMGRVICFDKRHGHLRPGTAGRSSNAGALDG